MPRFSLCHRYLNAFLVCAHEKSFSKASRLLYVSPTALIKQIEQLEEGIGTTLFERTPRGLVLTRSGSVLQSKVVNIAGAGAALVTFALAGQVDWHLGLIAGLFGIAGHYLGATLVVKNGTAIVRPIILIVLLALFAKTLWQYFA